MGLNAKRGTKPYDRGTKPYDRGTKPYDRGTKPYDRGTKPYDRGTKPYDRDTKPYDRATRPARAGLAGEQGTIQWVVVSDRVSPRPSDVVVGAIRGANVK
jgi:hypothetical protein